MKLLWFLLPPDKTVDQISLTVQSQAGLENDFRPLPMFDEDDGDRPELPPWEDDGIYPERHVLQSTTGQVRGYRLAKLVYYPLSYDALTESLTLLTSVHLTVHLRPLTTRERDSLLDLKRPEKRDDIFGRTRVWLAEITENPADLDLFYPEYHRAPEIEDNKTMEKSTTPFGTFVSEWPSTSGISVDHVIITDNYNESGEYIGDMRAVFQAYADMWSSFGITSRVKTVSEIETQYSGFDRASKIRAFIKDSYENWGISFVVLGGDESVVPTRRLGGPDQENWQRMDPVSDYWYTRFSSTWDELWNTDLDQWIGESDDDIDATAYGTHGFSSLNLGRLPARNSTEASNILYKTQRYMLLPPYQDDYVSTGYYRSALLAAGPLNSADTTSNANGIAIMENDIAPLFENAPEGGWTINKLYPFVGSVLEPGCSAVGDTCYYELHSFIENAIAPDTTHWWGNDLRDALWDVHTSFENHVVYHIAHSERDRLGHPRANSAIKPPVNFEACPGWDRDSCYIDLGAFFNTRIEHLTENQVYNLRNGTGQYATYNFVFSSGSETGKMEMESIGEGFLRAPEGGAVAYVGKTQTQGGPARLVFKNLLDKMFVQDETNYIRIGEAWGEACDQATGSPMEEIQYASMLPLLGEPLVWAYRYTPGRFETTISPDTLESFGIQSIVVTVEDSASAMPVSDAIVCLRQGSSLYAKATTDTDGMGYFEGVLVADSGEPVVVSALRPGWFVSQDTLVLEASEPYVAYSSHLIDDCGVGGDCDGELEVGETAEIEVYLKNFGTATAAACTTGFRASPTFSLELELNEEYRPSNILLGVKAARPTLETEVFSIPVTDRGVRVEGEPTTYAVGDEILRVWRSKDDGRYTLATHSGSQSSDSTWSGILKGAGGFSNVATSRDHGDAFFWSGDSI
jgi:hypothetical protein